MTSGKAIDKDLPCRDRNDKARGVSSAVAVVASLALVASLRAAEFPNPAAFNPTWESAKPGSSYSTDLPTAALLGNGSLGVVNGGDGNHKRFVLTRGDLWSCGDYTCVLNDKIAHVRFRGLKPATRYWYRIGAGCIGYKGGYNMKNLGSEGDGKIHSFSTLGAAAVRCVLATRPGSRPSSRGAS